MGGSFLRPRDLAKKIAQIALGKKAQDVLIIDVSKLLVITNYFVVLSGKNKRQVKVISDTIQNELRQKKIPTPGIEGEEAASWILLDYGDVVVHIFLTEERSYYQLERLFKDAPQTQLKEALKTSKL